MNSRQPTWKPRFGQGLAASYNHYIRNCGGAMTWDVPISPEGRIPKIFDSSLNETSMSDHASDLERPGFSFCVALTKYSFKT